MSTTRAPRALAGLVLAELLAVMALHLLGRVEALALPDDIGGWLGTAAPADAVMVVLRLVALGCAWWLLFTTVAYAAAQLSGRRVLQRAVRRVTLPAVRRVADRAIAVTLSTSSLLGGGVALAAEPVRPAPVVEPGGAVTDGPQIPDWLPPPGSPVFDDGDEPVAAPIVAPPEGEVDDGADRESVTGDPEGKGEEEAAAAGSVGAATSWTVGPGDDLWTIARAHLAAARGRAAGAPSDRDVHAVWLDVLRLNDGRLVSGDANLIHPGEEILLPEL